VNWIVGVGCFRYMTISVHITSVHKFLLGILRYIKISISVHDVFGTYEWYNGDFGTSFLSFLFIAVCFLVFRCVV